MAKSASKSSNKPAAKSAAKAAAAPAQAPTVALRGGIAVANVTLTGKPYNTKAAHNQQWWKAISDAKGGSVEALIKGGVPSHFIAYTIRRGYLSGK